MTYFLFFLLMSVALALFAGGLATARELLQSPAARELSNDDPFSRRIATVFATGVADPEFRRLQKRTIWLFVSAALALYLVRMVMLIPVW